MSACVVALALPSRFFPRITSKWSSSMVQTVSAWNVNTGHTQLFGNVHGVQRHLAGFATNGRTARSRENVATSRSAESSNGSTSDSDYSKKKKQQQQQQPKSKKLKIAEKITQANIDKLTAAFDELARKEGFDPSLQHFADGATFEDDFEYDDDFLDGVDDDDDDDAPLDGSEFRTGNNKEDQMETSNVDTLLDPMQFRLSDFSAGDDSYANDDGDEDNGSTFLNEVANDDDDDMDARINAAKRDMVPKPQDRFASEIKVDLSSLGYQEEDDPWGVDELPRKKEQRKEYQLVSDAMVCSACGADFQSSKETRPGFLPSEKFDIQVKLAKLEELQRLQQKAESKNDEWTPEDEIEWLIRSGGGVDKSGDDAARIDIAATAEEMGLDLEEITKKKTVCKRCHGLQNFGKVDDVLRPGWTEEPLLSQEKFRDLLRPIREKPAVIIALVDLFDFSGSVLPELDHIAGDNPVILAANKADLLPAKMGQVRAENWVRRELEYLGVRSLANIGGAVRLVSCKTGVGISAMLNKAKGLANEMDCDIYVVGAANAGKSTLLNYILGPDDDLEDGDLPKLRAGNRNKRKNAVTVSPLPGTTLKFIRVDIGGGRSLYDTPGLLVPGTLTQLLTPDELKIVVPKK